MIDKKIMSIKIARRENYDSSKKYQGSNELQGESQIGQSNFMRLLRYTSNDITYTCIEIINKIHLILKNNHSVIKLYH